MIPGIVNRGRPRARLRGGVRRNDDLGGTARSDEGPEAGVWVIAETAHVPTRYVKIVVTNDEGRYLMPDLVDYSTTAIVTLLSHCPFYLDRL